MPGEVVSALAGALVASAGALWLVGRQVAGLRATLTTFIAVHESVHGQLDGRVGRVEARLMEGKL